MEGKDLRIVFMGTPDFAVESLRALVDNGYNVVGVITVPDKPAGRGQKIMQSAVKKYAVEKELPVLQPTKLKAPDFIEELEALKADIQVVVAFRMLPEMVWAMPAKGTFNLHASLLPQYRGAAPLNWAIMNGDKEGGATTFMLQHQIDTGNIIDQVKVPIGEDDTVEVLHDTLMVSGAQLVLKTVDLIATGDLKMIPQESYIKEGEPLKDAPKIFKKDCKINWNRSCQELHNFIRGLSPYPAAWTSLTPLETGKESSAKIYRATYEVVEHQQEVGSIETDGKKFVKIACKDGFIQIHQLQLAGKKRMGVEDFLRGFQQIKNYKAD